MRKYRNVSGKSGVLAYEAGPDFIKLKFADGGGVYLYNYASAGRDKVEAMKALAEAGRGLSTFVVRNVREAYAAKLA